MSRFSSFLLAVLLSGIACGPALAGPIASGPVLAVGYSGDEDAADKAKSLYFVTGGWRWRFDGADCIDDFLAKGRIDFSWTVEPMIGGAVGDSNVFETSVVPYVRLAPLGWENVVPYFEGGIGISYTTLSGYGLGSHVNFSDNATLGVTFGSGRRWSIAYRFRHLSHAGLFDDDNEGLNAHFLVLGFE